MIPRLACAAVATLWLVASARAANWSVSRMNHVTLAPPEGVSVQEMSGVTYLGPVAGGLHRFLTVQEGHGALAQFDVSFNSSGAITGVSNISTIATPNFLQDFEGIAYTNPARNSAFVADESPAGPNVRELNLATGTSYQALSIPAVIKDNERANRGFESLTRTLDATAMWAANEQALTVDGPESTASVGAVVRLLKFNVAGNAVTTGPQYAYNVEPIHGASPLGSPQSALSDLTAMPDGTLLALERSVAATPPTIYLTRIFETNIAGATDISVGALGNGLIGQSYTPVAKTPLFAGAVDGANGQNLEGLALGPRLDNGSWVLLGVVDDGFSNGVDDDPLSNNTLVAFVATANVTGDFDADGDIDGDDLLRWQRGLGKAIGAKLDEGDGDRDGDVDAADLAAWRGAFIAAASSTAPEPAGLVVAIMGLSALASRRRASSQGLAPRQSG